MKNNKTFIGVYILIIFVSIFASLILIGLKYTTMSCITWLVALSPIWGLIAIEFILAIVILSIFNIKNIFKNNRKKYIVQNLY